MMRRTQPQMRDTGVQLTATISLHGGSSNFSLPCEFAAKKVQPRVGKLATTVTSVDTAVQTTRTNKLLQTIRDKDGIGVAIRGTDGLRNNSCQSVPFEPQCICHRAEKYREEKDC